MSEHERTLRRLGADLPAGGGGGEVLIFAALAALMALWAHGRPL